MGIAQLKHVYHSPGPRCIGCSISPSPLDFREKQALPHQPPITRKMNGGRQTELRYLGSNQVPDYVNHRLHIFGLQLLEIPGKIHQRMKAFPTVE